MGSGLVVALFSRPGTLTGFRLHVALRRKLLNATYINLNGLYALIGHVLLWLYFQDLALCLLYC
jgi:hypothetical protein